MDWTMLRIHCPKPRPSPCLKLRPSRFPTRRPSRDSAQRPSPCGSSTWRRCLAQHPSRFPSRRRALCPRRPSVIRDWRRPQKRSRAYHARLWWTMILCRVPNHRPGDVVPGRPAHLLGIPSHLYHLLLPTGSHPARTRQCRLRRKQQTRRRRPSRPSPPHHLLCRKGHGLLHLQRLHLHHLHHRPLQPAAQRGPPPCRRCALLPSGS